ncbi:citrulline utilization hydrolase CtlX [Saccharicrinis aurantiacus]|uniref:citrulline utilization hydrolase CtlX n=1 Tax=Saccharicrinis aurantiacus TaxID=1849719 RepID=UPI002492C2F5|nr:arginine deiminase-related protein [Saccharicrinis aurantiacus]
MQQVTDTILLIRPANFGYNTETASSNAFQNNVELSPNQIKDKSLLEFDEVVKQLRENFINVIVFDDTISPIKPDAIFPNNWASYHHDGKVLLYPMAAPNRRLERRMDIINSLSKEFEISEMIDLSHHEKKGKYLESTGSIIFDHVNKIAYACLSDRTNKELLLEVCDLLKYKPIHFNALDDKNKAIYHTNVMMCITENTAIVCLESIKDASEKKIVTDSLTESGHEIIDISLKQVKALAGNMLGVINKMGDRILVMSKSAHESLNTDQINNISEHSKILPLDVSTIEKIGGGSIRCMIAEIFLQKKP